MLAYVLRQLFLADFQSNGWLWFLELQVFFLWLYLDFSAYSDIAVGVGRLIGVATPENFNRPYVARNLVEFWERWHITLSDFIKRNIFIPIQMRLMRQRRWSPLLCANVAVSVSFVLCGLWHGIGVRFLVWGLVHCGGLMCVNTYRQMLSRHVGRSVCRLTWVIGACASYPRSQPTNSSRCLCYPCSGETDANPTEDYTTNAWCRVVWIAMQLLVAYYFISTDDPFFYQGF